MYIIHLNFHLYILFHMQILIVLVIWKYTNINAWKIQHRHDKTRYESTTIIQDIYLTLTQSAEVCLWTKCQVVKACVFLEHAVKKNQGFCWKYAKTHQRYMATPHPTIATWYMLHAYLRKAEKLTETAFKPKNGRTKCVNQDKKMSQKSVEIMKIWSFQC